LRTKILARAVVEQDEKLERGVVALGGNPVGDSVADPSFIDHDIVTVDDGYVGTFASFDGDDRVRGSSARRWILRRKTGGSGDPKD
jgi:hypothetical protein